MPQYAWPKSAIEIVNEIDDEFEIYWDTDSNIAILTAFIEENCDPTKFEQFVSNIAKEEIEKTKEELDKLNEGC